MKILKEFSNGNSSQNNNSSSQSSVTSMLKQQRFTLDGDSNDNSGLAIASNGMVALQYDMGENTFAVRPDNDLALDSETLSKFKQDITTCEKMADQLSKGE